jgi:hypothetical protein
MFLGFVEITESFDICVEIAWFLLKLLEVIIENP